MQKWIIFVVLSLSYLLVFFHRLCPAVVALDMMRDLQTGGALLGVLASAYFYPYAVMQLPAGLLADSWGPRRSMTVFFALAAAGSLVVGMADSIAPAVVGRILVGLGVSMIFVPAMKVFAVWFKREEFARLAGIFLAMGGLGSFTAAKPLAVMSGAVGWRMSFVAVGVLTLVLTALIWLVVRDKPAGAAAEKAGGPAGPGIWAGLRQVAGTRAFWPLAAWFLFDNAVFFSFGGLWGGPYLSQVYGMSKADAGWVLSMIAMGLIVGSPALSFLSDNVFRARKPVLVLTSLVVVAVTALLAFDTAGMSVPMLYAVFLGMGFCGAMVAIGFTMTKELFPTAIAGTALGFMNIFPFAGGAIFNPLLGAILERYGKTGDAYATAGYEAITMVLFVTALAATLSTLLVKETMRKA